MTNSPMTLQPAISHSCAEMSDWISDFQINQREGKSSFSKLLQLAVTFIYSGTSTMPAAGEIN